RVLNDIDDVAKVDHVRFLPRRVRPEGRVPPAAHDPFSGKKVYILAPPTSIVEKSHVLAEQPVAEEALHRPGKISPPDCCFVPVNIGACHRLTVLRSGHYNLL